MPPKIIKKRTTLSTLTKKTNNSGKKTSAARTMTEKKQPAEVAEINSSLDQQGNIMAIRDFRLESGKVAYLVQRQGTDTESWEAEDVIDNLEVLTSYQQNIAKDSGYTLGQVEGVAMSTSQDKPARLSKVKALMALKQHDTSLSSESEEELYLGKRKLAGSKDGQLAATKKRGHDSASKRKTKKQMLEEDQEKNRVERRAFRAELNPEALISELNHTNKSDCCLKCASNVYRDCLEKDDLESFKTAMNDISRIPHYENEDAPNGLDLICYAITLNKPEFLEIIQQFKSNATSQAQEQQRPVPPAKYTTYGDSTGHNSRGHMYAHRSFRDVQELRGNRLGNSAFYKGVTNTSARNTFMNVENGLHHSNFRSLLPVVSKEAFSVPEVIDLYVNFMGSSSLVLYFAVNTGNRLLASKLLIQLMQNVGRQTFNHLHDETLKNDSDQPLSAYKRPQILKMASDACNLTPFHCSAIRPSAEYLKTFYEALDASERLQTDAYGRTVAFYAAVSETTACLEYLLSVGFNVQQHDRYRMTPLVQAARMGRSHNVELIIKHIKDTNGIGDETPALLFDTLLRNKRTVLHYAAYYGHANTCRLLLQYGAPVDKMESLDKQTPLHYAAKNGYLDCVRVLIEEGKADPEKGDKFGRNALHLACFYGQVDIVRYLLAQGVDANAGDTSLNRPAHYAAAFGYIQILHLLLRYGQADPTVNNIWRSTPCSIANIKGHIAVVKYLLHLPGSPVDVNFKDENGRTMLQHCIQETISSESEMAVNLTKIKLLLAMNADSNSQDVYGNTPLHLLAMNDSYTSLQPKGWLPFYPQKVEGYWKPHHENSSKLFDDLPGIDYQIEVFQLLIKSKANLYIRNRQSETPFVSAMVNQHHYLVATFLETGYDFTIENNTTDTKGNNFFHFFGKLVAFVNSLRAHQPDDFIVRTRYIDVTNRIWNHIQASLANPHMHTSLAETYINAVNDDGYTPLLLSVSAAISLQKKAVAQDKELIACVAAESNKTLTFGVRAGRDMVSDAIQKSILERAEPLPIDVTLQFGFYVSIMEGFITLTKPNLDANITLPKDFDANRSSKKAKYPCYTGYTALHSACQSQCPELVALLLRNSAQANPRIVIKEWLGDTPMLLACHLKKDKKQELPDDSLETLQFIKKKFLIKKPAFDHLLRDTIKELLDYGASPYAAGEKGRTPLMVASSNLFTDIVQDLCTVKPLQSEDANIKDEHGQTAIMAALNALEPALTDNTDSVATAELLLKSSADVNAQYSNADTVFIKLIKLRYYPLFKVAVEESVRSIDHAYQNRERETALTVACRMDQQDVLQTYLESLKSASMVLDPNTLNKAGHTPLSYACKHGNATVVEQLLYMGADPNFCKLECIPLVEAIKSGSLSAVKSLLKHGAEVNLTDTDGNTPLHHAINLNRFRMVDALLEHNADCNRPNAKAQTPLHMAVEMTKKQTNRSFRIERSLINAGADINAVDFLGRTPLHYVFVAANAIPRTKQAMSLVPKVEKLRKELESEKSKKDRLEAFAIKYELDVQATSTKNEVDAWLLRAEEKRIDEEMKVENSSEKEGGNKVVLDNVERQALKPYLDCCLEKEDAVFERFDPIDILQYMSNFCDLEYQAQDTFGRAPIHYAACVGAFSCTTLLFEKGIDVNKLDIDKNGPLQLALLNNHVDYSVMLCSNGASVYDNLVLKNLSTTSTLGFALSKSLVNIAYMIMNKNYPILPFIRDALTNGKFHMAETAIRSVDKQILASALITENQQNIWHVIANFKPFDSEVWNEYLDSILPLICSTSALLRKDIHKRTPVHYAAMHGQDILLSKLVDMGVDINIPDEENLSEMNYAVDSGNINCVKILLEAGATVKRRHDGVIYKSALLRATENSQLDMIRLLLAQGALTDDGDSANGWPNCVMTACLKENIEILQLLIDYGCNVNTPSYIERTHKDGRNCKALVHPIFIVSALNNQQFLKTLLGAKGDPNVHAQGPDSEYGSSCFMYNVRKGFIENQKLLLDYGVDLNDNDERTGRSILYDFLFGSLQTTAAKNSNESNAFKIDKDVFAKMLKMDPSQYPQQLEVNMIDRLTGMTPLELTIRTDNCVLTEFLISRGANVNAISYGQNTTDSTVLPILNPLNQKLPAFLHALLKNNMAIITLICGKSNQTINWLWQDEEGNNIISYLVGSMGGYCYVNLSLIAYIVEKHIFADTLATLLTMNNGKGFCPLDFVYQYKSQQLYNFFMELCPELRNTYYPNAGAATIWSARETAPAAYVPITSIQVDEEANIERAKLRDIAAQKKKEENKNDKAEKKKAVDVDVYSGLQVAGVVLADEKNDCPYDTMLMKVELNSWGSYTDTTFYKLSIIQDTVLELYVLWTRWGPFAQEGQHQKAPYLTKEEAIHEFKGIFKSKTGNDWDTHQTAFEKKAGRYELLKTYHYPKDTLLENFDFLSSRIETSLSNEILNLMKLICNYRYLSSVYLAMNIDMPLGQLPQSRIEKARKLLEETAELINVYNDARTKYTDRNSLQQAKMYAFQIAQNCVEYSRLIPNARNNNSNVPSLYDGRKQLIHSELSRIDDISYVGFAANVILAAKHHLESINPLDYAYRALNCSLRPIKRLDTHRPEYQMAKHYMESTMGTPNHYEILHVYGVNRMEEEARFKPFETDPNRKLLWHGSRIGNFMGILKQGLRIRPRTTTTNGAMLGNGIYFADTFAKSLGYTSEYGSTSEHADYRILLLCEVALGSNQGIYINQAIPNYEQYESVLGRGKFVPDVNNTIYDHTGLCIPMGPCVPYVPNVNDDNSNTTPSTPFLHHNEYVVYNSDRVKIRYLLVLKKSNICELCETSSNSTALKPLHAHELKDYRVNELNSFEGTVIRALLAQSHEIVKQLFDRLRDSINRGHYRKRLNVPLDLSSESKVCGPCVNHVMSLVLVNLLKNAKEVAIEVPQSLMSRPVCKYGKECRTQRSSMHHAKTYQHWFLENIADQPYTSRGKTVSEAAEEVSNSEESSEEGSHYDDDDGCMSLDE